jgi:large subunit ribosomal protein L31
MKSTIHPTWFSDAVVTCSCGNTFTTGSTKQEIKVDICSACHPFYTGEMRFVDVQGRVEKFQAKWNKSQAYRASVKAKKQKAQKSVEVKSLKDMLENIKTDQPANLQSKSN